MKLFFVVLSAMVSMFFSFTSIGDVIKSTNIGEVEITYSYEPLDEGRVSFSITSVLDEYDSPFRSILNKDQRRLSKIGQLIYQCKLMLYNTGVSQVITNDTDSVLVSRYFALLTNVDMELGKKDIVGVHVYAADEIAGKKNRPSPTVGIQEYLSADQGLIGQARALNLKKLNIDSLIQADIIGKADILNIDLRFPVFQLKKPVKKWTYEFELKNFKKAITHTDEQCTPQNLMGLIDKKIKNRAKNKDLLSESFSSRSYLGQV